MFPISPLVNSADKLSDILTDSGVGVPFPKKGLKHAEDVQQEAVSLNVQLRI